MEAAEEKETDSREKRFHTIMDKLFHAPGPKRPSSASPSPSVGIGKKRAKLNPPSILELSSGWELVDDDINGARRSLVAVGPSQAGPPLCRPWDRGDLMKRLATFKSMTWFGKPKVVSPINCARRGWVNVEMDIIACEACGARLLFSTPSSWTQQQVEKAAAVFSLKLDSGHKQLCPWIDNACDDSLALFPPTPAPALIQGYKERFSSLLQLSALPVISSSAIDYMRSPQLEKLLAQAAQAICTLDDDIQPSCASGSEEPNSESDAFSANLYLQAQKLISLCGWEPRLLPYVVDCEDRSAQSGKGSHPTESPQIIGGQIPNVIIYPSTDSDETAKIKDNGSTLGEHLADPGSVVLDCKLCGASVGLWAFMTVPRPLELFRLIESVEVNGKKDSANCGLNMVNSMMEAPNTGYNSSLASMERGLSLNLTIAGGPPPTKQHVKATVSLPIISRHLRAGFCSNSVVGKHVVCDTLSIVQEDHSNSAHTGQVVQIDDAATLKHKRNDDELCIARGSSSNDQSHLIEKSNEMEKTPRNEEMSAEMSREGRHSDEQRLPSMHADITNNYPTTENPIDSVQNMTQDSGGNNTFVEDAQNTGAVTSETGAVISQDGECFDTTLNANGFLGYGGISEENSAMLTAYDYNQKEIDFSVVDILQWIEDPQGTLNDSSHLESCFKAKGTVDGCHDMNLRKGIEVSDVDCSADGQTKNQMVEAVKDTLGSSVSNDTLVTHGKGNDLKAVQKGRKMEFDPIRQHRHFCPWIASTDGGSMPGWKQTLSVLYHAAIKESPPTLAKGSTSASSVFEVDDPIASVRKLFMSPSEKRTKVARQSN